MDKRASGILMHITSLPSRFGIGDFGPWAYQFIDFLEETHQTYWQVLPLNPTSFISGNSPYASFSAFAGNTLLISPDHLKEMQLLSENELDPYPSLPEQTVDYKKVTGKKIKLFHLAHRRFKEKFHQFEENYNQFCSENANWLDDYAAFIAFKGHFDDRVWSEWPEEIRDRDPDKMNVMQHELSEQIDFEKFLQFIFYTQWNDVRGYANERGIRIIGDIPYYVNYDSADVWTNPQLFKLDESKSPTHVAGVPPDYFSETGQLWGNPVYDWSLMKQTNFAWWIQRIAQNLKLYDFIRIDHFRGFLAYWEVPASETTAVNGEWTPVPGEQVFQRFRQVFPHLPILAEDLGVITDDVRELMQKFELPGMRILVFAFDESLPQNAYAPHNHIPNSVVYTGTHDNNTVRGWFEQETSDRDKQRIFKYLGRTVSAEQIHLEFIRLAMMSVARIVIFPLQDILGLNSDHRMNRPATLNGNWNWRLQSTLLSAEIKNYFSETTTLFGRSKDT